MYFNLNNGLNQNHESDAHKLFCSSLLFCTSLFCSVKLISLFLPIYEVDWMMAGFALRSEFICAVSGLLLVYCGESCSHLLVRDFSSTLTLCSYYIASFLHPSLVMLSSYCKPSHHLFQAGSPKHPYPHHILF